MSDEVKRKVVEKTLSNIRDIDNKIYLVKLTFKELDQTRSWLDNVVTEEEIEERILERVIVAFEEAKQTGVSV